MSIEGECTGIQSGKQRGFPVGIYRWCGLLVCLAYMAACSRAPESTPTPVATPLPAIGASTGVGSSVRASGAILPAHKARLSLTTSGRVESLAVQVGDQADAGAVLVVLENTAVAAAVAQAHAVLLRAQANLAELEAGPRLQEIAAAQAGLDAAQALLAQLTEEPRPEEIAAAEAEVAAVQARYDTLYAEPNAALVAAARAEVKQAEATLGRLLHPATASQIAQAEAQVRSAQAELDLLTSGAREEAVAAAAATVAEAEAALQRAQADMASTQLRAPFTGTVTALGISPGELATAGQSVMTLADLMHLQVETTDLSERDVVHVTIGQPVIVFLEALSTDVAGRVAQIAPQSSVIGGDVVYSVVIELDEQPAELRWGMSVEVEIPLE